MKSIQLIGFDGKTLNEKCDIEKIKEFLQTQQIETRDKLFFKDISKNLDSIWAIFHHRELATRQRNSYQNMRNNLTSNDVVIVIDYKQKVKYLYFMRYINALI